MPTVLSLTPVVFVTSIPGRVTDVRTFCVILCWPRHCDSLINHSRNPTPCWVFTSSEMSAYDLGVIEQVLESHLGFGCVLCVGRPDNGPILTLNMSRTKGQIRNRRSLRRDHFWSRGSSVSMETKLRGGRPGFNSQ
jgi:hypothetical protein